jgi:hypothetical protein
MAKPPNPAIKTMKGRKRKKKKKLSISKKKKKNLKVSGLLRKGLFPSLGTGAVVSSGTSTSTSTSTSPAPQRPHAPPSHAPFAIVPGPQFGPPPDHEQARPRTMGGSRADGAPRNKGNANQSGQNDIPEIPEIPVPYAFLFSFFYEILLN